MTVRVDNSYMYKYLEEMHQRNVARTAAEHAKSKAKKIPYVLAKYGGIAIIILSIGVAIYFANSYKQISKNTEINQAYELTDQNQYSLEKDEVIDIEAIIRESKVGQDFPEPDSELFVEQSSVRNYVIFDSIEFQHQGIQKITIGRRYDNPDSEVNSSWCYVDKQNLDGIKNTLHLVIINDERDELEITDEIAESFGVSKILLEEAKKLCGI
mgnify:FL=1|tara:strand:- start:473 stop:1108 length:636 start_codon:yes stop_codon:yes gene_type:complete